jgi:L-ascorbate metabolism protein UlaG (beta-lactamase superfamily)
MQISWQGFNYFKISNSQRSIILNPYSLDKNTKFSKVKADVVLFTDPKSYIPTKVNEQSFVVDSSGEYEVSDIFVYGRQLNGANIYLITFEDIKIAFLGEYGHTPLTDKDLELIEGADILILPVGGGDLATAKEAVKIIGQVEPRLVIPSCHKVGMGKIKADDIHTFIKEFGVKPEELDKLKISKRDLPQEDVKLFVLKPQK